MILHSVCSGIAFRYSGMTIPFFRKLHAGNNGYGIYIDKDCTGNVKININNTLSITGKVYIKGVENTLSTGTNTY